MKRSPPKKDISYDVLADLLGSYFTTPKERATMMSLNRALRSELAQRTAPEVARSVARKLPMSYVEEEGQDTAKARRRQVRTELEASYRRSPSKLSRDLALLCADKDTEMARLVHLRRPTKRDVRQILDLITECGVSPNKAYESYHLWRTPALTVLLYGTKDQKMKLVSLGSVRFGNVHPNVPPLLFLIDDLDVLRYAIEEQGANPRMLDDTDSTLLDAVTRPEIADYLITVHNLSVDRVNPTIGWNPMMTIIYRIPASGIDESEIIEIIQKMIEKGRPRRETLEETLEFTLDEAPHATGIITLLQNALSG